MIANTYLNKLDHAWAEMNMDSNTGHNAHLIRYADDILVLTDDARSFTFSGKNHARNVMKILWMLVGKLKLKLSESKSRITTAEEGFDFLGFHFLRRYWERYGKCVSRFFPSKKSELNYKAKVSEITSRRHAHTKSEDDVIRELDQLTIGWTNYYNHSHASETYAKLWNFLCWRLTQFIRYRHKRRSLAVDYVRLRSYGLMPPYGRIRHNYTVCPR